MSNPDHSGKMSYHVKPVAILATDNYQLEADIFQPMDPSNKIVIINAGVGIRGYLYKDIAAFLAEHGYTVITYDYRGIGKSRPENLKGFQASFLDWGRKDFVGILNYVQQNLKPSKIFVIAHSTGGVFLGLAENNQCIDGVVAVATQSGYWNLWPGFRKLVMLSLSYVILPLLCFINGYFPAKRLGWGDDYPKDVALVWCEWVKRKNYLFDFPEQVNPSYFDQLKAPILWYSFSDDNFFAPKKAVDWFSQRYPNAKVIRKHIDPKSINLKSLGHSGIFLKKSKVIFWNEILNFFDNIK